MTGEDERAQLDKAVEEFLTGIHLAGMTDAQVWNRQFDAGLAWIDFPVGSGGLGLSRTLRSVAARLLADASVPDAAAHNAVGYGLVAPLLVSHGSKEQCARHLRPLFVGEELWCQLFSEPGAGSDLAGLSTRADALDGGGWTVNGQKVWTTLGHAARFGILAARTDPALPKHRGLSMFVVDMHTPGVDVRGIREITGAADFNEVFLRDVALPADAIVGALGGGWLAVVALLANERAAFSETLWPYEGGAVGQALALWRERGAGRPELADRFTRLWVRAEAVRLAELSASRAEAAGTASSSWSFIKIARSELDQSIYDFCVTLLAADGLEYPSYTMHQPESMAEVRSSDADVRTSYLFHRSLTIAGGTTEIQRTIVADRVLRLPREPQPDHDTPWRELRRS